jgi:hypothetical protein
VTDKERLISRPKISATRNLPPDEGTNNYEECAFVRSSGGN